MNILTKSFNQDVVDGIFRIIVERSAMMNNDERVLYSHGPTLDIPIYLAGKVNIILSRPHFKCEGEIYLQKEKWSIENSPQITLFIDAIWRVKNQILLYNTIVGNDPSKIVASIIGANYYDCMSGGMPIYMVYILREICKSEKINKEKHTYPSYQKGNDGWLNIQDFLDETKDVNIQENLAKMLQ